MPPSKKKNKNPRTALVQQAKATVEALENGNYVYVSSQEEGGKTVDFSKQLRAAVEGTRLYRPNVDLACIKSKHQTGPAPAAETTSPSPYPAIQVTTETTLAAVSRLILKEGVSGDTITMLNFASAKNPGGGFLSGAKAQEESLARGTGLYSCLGCTEANDYYQTNRKCGTLMYTHNILWSPLVPVLKNDAGEFLPESHYVSIISAPAPNRSQIIIKDDHDAARAILKERMMRILHIARINSQTVLVLGAWGCGVFANPPEDVAQLFSECLKMFPGCFDRVIFPIYSAPGGDRTQKTPADPFAEAFGVSVEAVS